MGFTPFTLYLNYLKWSTNGYISYIEAINKQTYRSKHTYATKDTYVVQNEAFQVLGIQPTDDKITIKNAYRKLALSYHPDVYDGGNEKFIQIKEAYETIIKSIS